jgi:hypothetical protein
MFLEERYIRSSMSQFTPQKKSQRDKRHMARQFIAASNTAGCDAAPALHKADMQAHIRT